MEVGGLGEAELWIVGGPDEGVVLVDIVVIPGGFVAREVESEAKIFFAAAAAEEVEVIPNTRRF